jgi:FkbM family methyltransferase
MHIPGLRRARRAIAAVLGVHSDRFLRDVHGVIHVGASDGQERESYARLNLPVVWIEPIPEVFDALTANLARLPHDAPPQRAFRRLITDTDGQTVPFHIANNNGESSSILPLKDHSELWPEVKFDRTITLTTSSLASFIRDENIDLATHDALVMDTQGAELLVLRGAGEHVRRFRYIKTETFEFEAYAGCCTLPDLDAFAKSHGFSRFAAESIATLKGKGSMLDVVYKRDA